MDNDVVSYFEFKTWPDTSVNQYSSQIQVHIMHHVYFCMFPWQN